MVPSAAESFLVKPGCAISRTCENKDRQKAVFLISEGLIPDAESSFFMFTDVEVTKNGANPRITGQCGVIRV